VVPFAAGRCFCGGHLRVEWKIALHYGRALVGNWRWQNTSSTARFDFKTKSSRRWLM